MYQQRTATVHIFLQVLTTGSLVFFLENISRTAILTQASVITYKYNFQSISCIGFTCYNFIFQRLIWKMVSVYFLCFNCWTLKEWKTAKIQNHSVFLLFTQMIDPLFDMFTAALFIFSTTFLYMCKPRTTFCLFWWDGLNGLAFYERGLACLPSCVRMLKADWLGSMWSKIFLQMKFINFQGFFTKQVAFLPGQPTPYNQLLIQPLLLFPEWYFA